MEDLKQLNVAARRRPVAWRDLQLAGAGAVALLGLLALGEAGWLLAPLRIVLGLAYVLFVPGYCLYAALFPQPMAHDRAERIGLSCGLSVALVPVLALLLDQLPWGIGAASVLAAEGGVVGVCVAVALWRRARLGTVPAAPADMPGEGHMGRGPAALGAALLVAMALAAAWVFLMPAQGAVLTEFYVLNGAGAAEDYPLVVQAGTELHVVVGIANHERAVQTYRVEVWAGGTSQAAPTSELARLEPLTLAPEEERRLPLSWRTAAPGAGQQVNLLLFRGDERDPYRRLRLWIDVR